jgi:hypothetical protein
MRRLWLVCLASSLLLPSCIEGDERTDEIVTELRILGARVEVLGQEGDFADADVGDRVRLSVLLGNPQNVGPVRVSWVACLPQHGQVTPCEDEGVLRDPASLAGRLGVLTLGEGESIEIDVPREAAALVAAVLARADLNASAACSVFIDVPLVVSASAGQRTVFATKKWRLTPYRRIAEAPERYRYVRNANPAVDRLVLVSGAQGCDGPPLSSLPQEAQQICVLIPHPAQPVTRCGIEGPIEESTEDPEVGWYASGGSIEGEGEDKGRGLGGHGSGMVLSTVPVPPGYYGRVASISRPPGPFTIWAVVRDGRGGVAWLRQDVE